jgi:hypothetical protein
VNEARGLLGLAQNNGPNFAVYDLNGDCAHPKLASSISVSNSRGHMGGWADDGKTYYIGQSFRGVGGILPIIDVTNPYDAKWLLDWTFNGDGRPAAIDGQGQGRSSISLIGARRRHVTRSWSCSHPMVRTRSRVSSRPSRQLPCCLHPRSSS